MRTTVGGQITSSGDVTVLSSVFTSVYAAHEAENFSLGVASGVVTVNADDATSVTTEVGGGASITSTGGTVNVFAYHNFDGSNFTSDDVEANSEALSIAAARLARDRRDAHVGHRARRRSTRRSTAAARSQLRAARSS